MSKDNRLFYVGQTSGPAHNRPGNEYRGALAAYRAAIAQGDPCTVYLWDGRRKHWELIVDRSMPDVGRLPLRTHLRNVLRVVEMVPQLREVGTGKPGYRWTPGYLVPTLTGLEYPPVSRNVAIARCRELYGARCVVVVQ